MAVLLHPLVPPHFPECAPSSTIFTLNSISIKSFILTVTNPFTLLLRTLLFHSLCLVAPAEFLYRGYICVVNEVLLQSHEFHIITVVG